MGGGSTRNKANSAPLELGFRLGLSLSKKKSETWSEGNPVAFFIKYEV